MSARICSSSVHVQNQSLSLVGAAATARRPVAVVSGVMKQCNAQNERISRAFSVFRGMKQNHVNPHKTMATAASEEVKPVDPEEGTPEWYAVVARADFFFNDVQNETLAEQLRELKRYYEEKNRKLDFFFVSEPEWLDRFPEASKVQRPCVALVSTDKEWMIFMKLRLDRVLKIDLGKMSIDEATKSTAPVPEFKPPEKWTAPYAPYAPGWWEVFMRN